MPEWHGPFVWLKPKLAAAVRLRPQHGEINARMDFLVYSEEVPRLGTRCIPERPPRRAAPENCGEPPQLGRLKGPAEWAEVVLSPPFPSKWCSRSSSRTMARMVFCSEVEVRSQ
jgi:hypothetical protein